MRQPLLIVRECEDKKLTELLDAALKSERLQLASQWFHCVRVDGSIAQSEALFGKRNPAHMVLSSWDGKKRVKLLGTTSQKVTWSKITSVLKADYSKSPNAAIKVLEQTLNKYDALDARQTDLAKQLERAKEAKKSAQQKKVAKQLAKLDGEREELIAREKKALDLGRRRDHEKTGD